MSISSNWRQNNNWRMGVPLNDRRDEKPAPRNPDGTTETHQRVHRRPPNLPRQAVTQPGSSESVDTIAEGRRIYLGNLLYRINPGQIEDMLATEGFGEEVESVHISVDAVSGRNPGYCFVDFKTRDGAQTALESLTGTLIQGRPVKVGPCQPKRAEVAGQTDDYTPTFQRWGDWKGPRPGDPAEHCPGEGIKQGPYGALDHIDEMSKADAPARVYIGGLGKMINQKENDREIRAYLDGFNVFVYHPPNGFRTDKATLKQLTNGHMNSEASQ